MTRGPGINCPGTFARQRSEYAPCALQGSANRNAAKITPKPELQYRVAKRQVEKTHQGTNPSNAKPSTGSRSQRNENLLTREAQASRPLELWPIVSESSDRHPCRTAGHR